MNSIIRQGRLYNKSKIYKLAIIFEQIFSLFITLNEKNSNAFFSLFIVNSFCNCVNLRNIFEYVKNDQTAKKFKSCLNIYMFIS